MDTGVAGKTHSRCILLSINLPLQFATSRSTSADNTVLSTLKVKWGFCSLGDPRYYLNRDRAITNRYPLIISPHPRHHFTFNIILYCVCCGPIICGALSCCGGQNFTFTPSLIWRSHWASLISLVISVMSVSWINSPSHSDADGRPTRIRALKISPAGRRVLAVHPGQEASSDTWAW